MVCCPSRRSCACQGLLICTSRNRYVYEVMKLSIIPSWSLLSQKHCSVTGKEQMKNSRLQPCLSLLALLVFVHLFPISLHAQSEKEPARVATTPCPPFVMKESGELSGLSIYLWNRIAQQLDIESRIEVLSLKDVLDNVSQAKVDVGVSCLSINEERERTMDFSHSFYETHLAIAVKQRGYMNAIKRFLLSGQVLIALGELFGAAALIGGIFFLLEHKINRKLYSMKSRGGRLLEAFTIGLLFVTNGPIRYYEFRSSTARFLSAVLAIGSTLMIASITAVLASAFTLDQLRSEIKGPKDLSSVRVGTLGASTSAKYLQENGIAYRKFSNLKEMIAALDTGHLDAVVSDAAFLRYEIKRGKESGRFESLSVLPYEFEKQNYGIALPENSPHIEKLNQALLSVRGSLKWKQEVIKYLGER